MAGLPFEERGSKGREWKFCLAAVVQWLKQRAEDAARDTANDPVKFHKARLLRAKANIAELKFQLSTGAMVPTSEIEAGWHVAAMRFKQRILAIPTRIAPLVAVETEAGACRKILECLCLEALAELDDTKTRKGMMNGRSEER